MIKNISYKYCVCDICKEECEIDPSLDLPNGWQHIEVGQYSKVDACCNCTDGLATVVHKLKNKELFLSDILGG